MINGRPIDKWIWPHYADFPYIHDDDLSPYNPKDNDGKMFWHKIKDLAMNKWNIVMIFTGWYIDNLKTFGSTTLALESLNLIEVGQLIGNPQWHPEDGPFRSYSRIGIGNYDTDKFKFSITPPLISGEIDSAYYIPDYSFWNEGLRYLFAGQVGIGPTLNLDWILGSGNKEMLSTNYMFDGCENLEEISMPYRPNPEIYSDQDHYKCTFRNCHKLKKLDDGPTLTKGNSLEHDLIGTFENCYSLKYINFQYVDPMPRTTIPPNQISKTVFKNCNSLQAIFIANWDNPNPNGFLGTFDKLNSEDKQVITDKFKNLLRLSGINPDTIYIGKYDLTVIH